MPSVNPIPASQPGSPCSTQYITFNFHISDETLRRDLIFSPPEVLVVCVCCGFSLRILSPPFATNHSDELEVHEVDC